MLYHYSETVSTENYETDISQEVLNEAVTEMLFHDWDMFSILNLFVQSWSRIDLDEYLSSITLNWCITQLQTQDINLQHVNAENAFPDKEQSYCTIYLQLWEIIQSHMNLQTESILSEMVKPQRDLVNVTKLQGLSASVQNLTVWSGGELDLVNEGPNLNMKLQDFEKNLS